MSLNQVGTFTRAHVRVTYRTSGGTYSVECGPGDGDLQLADFYPDCRERITVMDRGTPSEDVVGDIVPVTGSITVRQVGKVTMPADLTISDVLLGTGLAVTATTTTDPGGVVARGDMKIEMTRGGITTGYDLYNVGVSGSFSEAKEGNAFAISFEANGRAAAGLLPIVPF